VRLALVLSGVVVAVLLVTGLAVNRLVSRGLEDQLADIQRDRLSVLAQQFEGLEIQSRRHEMAITRGFLGILRDSGGRLAIVEANGDELVAAGQVRPGVETQRIEEAIPGDEGRTLVFEVPAGRPAFLGVFNATLLVAGVLAVGALVLASALLSERLTRPLRGVAAAAGRLGSGDMSARAEGGADRESRELAGAFNAMAERLERSEALRRRAAADMAHDLATPATVLESQLQAMVDGVVPANRVELERARAAAGALSGVIVQLRELIDAEAAATQRSARRLSVAEVLGEATQALEPYSRERAVRLRTDPVPEATLEVDPTQVGRALRNVLSNAIQHSPAGGEVVVSAEALPDEVVVRVTDAGSGIAAADLPHVFERFYRADPSRGGAAQSTGSGIGLTIARELLAANGGSIEVEGTRPEGTTFALRLPRVA
jgi:signal transduction histidine kinase